MIDVYNYLTFFINFDMINLIKIIIHNVDSLIQDQPGLRKHNSCDKSSIC